MYVCDRCGRGIDWEPCIVRMESPYRSVGGRRDVGLELCRECYEGIWENVMGNENISVRARM
jgi:hypothetical protein